MLRRAAGDQQRDTQRCSQRFDPHPSVLLLGGGLAPLYSALVAQEPAHYKGSRCVSARRPATSLGRHPPYQVILVLFSGVSSWLSTGVLLAGLTKMGRLRRG